MLDIRGILETSTRESQLPVSQLLLLLFFRPSSVCSRETFPPAQSVARWQLVVVVVIVVVLVIRWRYAGGTLESGLGVIQFRFFFACIAVRGQKDHIRRENLYYLYPLGGDSVRELAAKSNTKTRKTEPLPAAQKI